MTAVDARQATPRDLWAAVDALTNPSRVRLPRDFDLPPEWVTLPSLWDQLADAIDSSTGRGARGAQRSRPPCNAEALSLLLEIATAVRDGCHRARLKRTRDVPRDLRQIVSNAIRTTDPDIINGAHIQVRGWVAEVRLTISNDPDRSWRMHGAACRTCGSTTVSVWDKAGEETHQPALIVHSEDGVVDMIECAFCGSVLTGDDLTQLLYDTLRRPVGLRDLTEPVQ
jgi:hypothetical protein